MTTIAYRDGVLAADTLNTSGTYRDGYVTKIVKKGRILAGASGCGIMTRRFLDWVRAGMPGDAPAMVNGEDKAYGHIFMPDGTRLTLWPNGWATDRQAFWADGSGWEFAKGAMAMGASAEQAIGIAVQHDTKSGGEIVVLRH